MASGPTLTSGGGMGGMGRGGGAMAAEPMAPAAAASGGAGMAARQAFVPLGQLARVETVMGAPMIKSELGSLTGWVAPRPPA